MHIVRSSTAFIAASGPTNRAAESAGFICRDTADCSLRLIAGLVVSDPWLATTLLRPTTVVFPLLLSTPVTSPCALAGAVVAVRRPADAVVVVVVRVRAPPAAKPVAARLARAAARGNILLLPSRRSSSSSSGAQESSFAATKK